MKPFRSLGSFARRFIGVTKRAITSLPWVAGGPLPSQVSTQRALSLIPFFACIRLLSEQISALPLHAYRQEGDRQVRVNSRLLSDPAAYGTRVRWMRQCVISLAMRGNAYGLIVARDGFGNPTDVEWLCPDEVHVDETRPTLPRFYWRGMEIPLENVVHIAWFVEPGKVKGLSPVSAFAASIGVGLSATDYGASWFDHGGTPPGTFRNSARTLTPEQAEAMSQRLDAAIKKRRPLVYGSDWDFKTLEVSPEESQFIETMKLNATQMANIFGVPPEMVGGESGGPLTYDNPEMNGMSFHKFALRGWLTLLESEFTRLLPERQFAEFNADAIIRADIQTRYAAHQIGLDSGFLTVNEVRALEGRPPVEGGDTVRPRINPIPLDSRAPMTIDDLFPAAGVRQ